jgi:hypothetical protein
MPMATLFSSVGTIAAITGVVFVMLSGPMRRLTGGIK